jgi:non-ribosomal peptide synthetase component F
VEPERDLSHAPLFQVMLVWNNAPVESLEMPGLRVEGVETESGTARFDLTLEMGEGGDGLWGSFEYARDLWEEATVARLAEGLGRLLEQMSGEKRISELKLLSAAEERRMLVEWNATECEYPGETTIHALFEAEAREHPDRVALRFEGEAVRYGELDRRASELARQREPGQLVAIERERSIEQVVEQLAALKAGGAYVPIDPGYPEERRRYMREDSGAGQDKVSGLAYVIYTSGSTGRPKGTEVEHAGLCNLVRWQKKAFGITERSRVLQFAPASFDASVWETYMALANGGTLVLARQEELASMEALHGLLAREKITVVTLPPSVLAVLGGSAENGNVIPLRTASLWDFAMPTDYAVTGSRLLSLTIER